VRPHRVGVRGAGVQSARATSLLKSEAERAGDQPQTRKHSRVKPDALCRRWSIHLEGKDSTIYTNNQALLIKKRINSSHPQTLINRCISDLNFHRDLRVLVIGYLSERTNGL
jgi:hypothetical protein